MVRDFFEGEAAGLDVAPITEEEVRAYYREDALIWTLYLSMRKVDRFLRVRLLAPRATPTFCRPGSNGSGGRFAPTRRSVCR